MFAAVSLDPFLIGALGAAIPALLSAWFVRRKTKAETADIITGAAGRLVEQLERRITDLESRLSRSESREAAALVIIAELRAEISTLRRHVDANPHTPITTTTITSSVTEEKPS